MRHLSRAVLLAAGSLVLLASTATALPACLQDCRGTPDCCEQEACLQEPCAFLRAQEAALREDLNACIATCPATSPGRCTVLLGCVRKCQSFFRSDLKAALHDAFESTTCAAGCRIKGPKARRAALRACRGCTSVTTTTSTTTTSASTSTSSVTTTSLTGTTRASTTTTTTTTLRSTTTLPGRPTEPDDRCQRACLERIDSLQACYDDCKAACEGNQNAVSICRGVCRNSVCLAIKARCAWDPDAPTPEDVDPQYRDCCTRQDSCLGRSETDACQVTTSTTTTTTTTASTASTSSSTTTTLSPF